MEKIKKISEIKASKRKIALFIFILLVGLGIVVLKNIKQKPVIRDSLSQRSKEFLKSQKFAPNSRWGNVNLEGNVREDTRNQRIGKGDCYSFVIPFRVTVGNYEEQPGSRCYMRLTFDRPKGAIVSYIFDHNEASINEVAPIIQRRRDVDEYYPEEIKTLGGKTFIMFKGKVDVYEKNAFYFTPSNVFVFNLLTRTNENLDKEFDQMLSTLRF